MSLDPERDPLSEFLSEERQRTEREVLQPLCMKVKRKAWLRRGYQLNAGGELRKGNTLSIPKEGLPTINNLLYVPPVKLRNKIAIFVFTKQFVYKILPSLITTVAKADIDTGEVISCEDLINDIALSVGETSTMTLRSLNWGENIGTPGLYTPENLRENTEDVIPNRILIVSSGVIKRNDSLHPLEWDCGNIRLDFFQSPGI